jgi:hypothetical protein
MLNPLKTVERARDLGRAVRGAAAAPKARTFQTYTKTNARTGETYTGRKSGTGTPAQNVARRDSDHHKSQQGFGPARLDRSSSNTQAIRGREQQMIERHGGAKSQGGTSGNAINGISPRNSNGPACRGCGNKGIWIMLRGSRPQRVRRTEGSILKVPLGAGKVAYGLVLREPVVAFFDRECEEGDVPPPEALLDTPVAFRLMVMNHAITQGRWPVVGRIPVPDALKIPPPFCKQDEITGRLSIYHEVEPLAPHYERHGTLEECRSLETAAVWDPEHVEDRLRDHFAGRPNIWVEQLRISP